MNDKTGKNEGNKKEKGAVKKLDKKAIALIAVGAAILAVLSVPLWLKPDEVPEETLPTTVPTTEPAVQAPTTEPPTEPPTEPTMLPEMEELYNKNKDFSSWLTIADTVIDYPVMFTPGDEEKYIYRGFDGKYDWNGSLFINEDCSFEPETQVIIVYGHNKVYGGMFHDLLEYRDQKYWEEHRYITFKTLYEERTYEIFGAFDDRVYMQTDDVFKFYYFIDPQTEEEFMEGVNYFKEKTPYDTGVEVEYGDHLLTLITCSYSGEYGRYVVVGRQMSPEEVEQMKAEQAAQAQTETTAPAN